jgi:xylose dehydrogenase (NAD/NADP)
MSADGSDARRLRLGILGAGRIAQKAIAPAALKARNVALVAAASRELSRAQSLGARRAYNSYDALLNDSDVDAVFITTHNGLHCELAIAAMQRGKHVLCEKPLAPSVKECEQIVARSNQSQLRVMEAFMYRYHPQIAALQEVAHSGRIGDVRRLNASFHFHLDRPDDVRLDPTIGGGALLDVGCYCVNASRLFLGEEIADVSASAKISGPNGVDMEGQAKMAFKSGASADISWGFIGPMRQELTLTGTKGVASLNWAFAYRGEPQTLEIRLGASTQVMRFDPPPDTYQLEIEDFAGGILEDRAPMLSAREGLLNARVMDKIREAFTSR